MRGIRIGAVAISGTVVALTAGLVAAGPAGGARPSTRPSTLPSTLPGPPPSPSGPPSPSSPSSRSGPTASGPAARVVQLPTGEWVRYSVVGDRPRIVVTPTSRRGIEAVHSVEQIAGHQYVFPGAARRYLGRFLDPALFDVTAAKGNPGRVPIRMTYARAMPSVPGVTITQHAGGRADGYLADATAFGRALTAQWRHDARPGAPAPTALLGATFIGTTPAGSHVRPAYQQETLILKVLDPGGRPVPSGAVLLMNTDDPLRFDSLVPFSAGTARASVPVGHYSAFTELDGYDPITKVTTSYLLPLMDYEVTRNLQTLVLDARAATATPSVRTPKPARRTELGLDFQRFAATGARFEARVSLADLDSVVHIVPSPAPAVGRMALLTEWGLAGTRGAYTYSLGFRDVAGVPANQSRTVRTAQLATVNARYYADHPGQQETFARSLTDLGTTPQPLTPPLQRREYVLSPPGATWTESLYANPTEDNPYGAEMIDGWRTYTAGSVRTAEWLRGALAPGVAERTNGDPGFSCYWCRTDSSLAVLLTPVVDTTPGHGGFLDLASDGSPVARYRLYRDGVLVDDEPDVTGTMISVPSTRATYRVIDDVKRLGFVHSTAATVDVTFSSAAGQGGRRPTDWDCGLLNPPTCTVLPILRVAAPLPTTLSGTMPIGPRLATFTVSHVPGAQRLPITGADVQLSPDNGQTWHRVRTVPRGNGRYQVLLLNSRAWVGHAIKIRIHATDAAGGAITQTVAAAYTVTAS